METISIEQGSDAVDRAVEVLRNGGVILYPTDTVYGLGCDAFSDEAVAKIYEIKGREANKPLIVLASDNSMVETYAEMNVHARKLAEKFWPGPLTMVLAKRAVFKRGVGKRNDTIAMRVPDSDFCRKVARSFGKPIISTSANKAGDATFSKVDEIVAQLEKRAELIDLVIDGGTLANTTPSTVIKVSAGVPTVLRQGAIDLTEFDERAF